MADSEPKEGSLGSNQAVKEQTRDDLADSRAGFKPTEIFTPDESEENQHFTTDEGLEDTGLSIGPVPITRRTLVLGGAAALVATLLGIKTRGGNSSASAAPAASNPPKPTPTIPDSPNIVVPVPGKPVVEPDITDPKHELSKSNSPTATTTPDAIIGPVLPDIEDKEPLLDKGAAEKRWQEFLKDSDKFIKEHPELVVQYRVAGKGGLVFRFGPGANNDPIEGNDLFTIKAGDPIGGVGVKIGQDPDGEWVITSRDSTEVFYSLADTELDPRLKKS